MTPQEIAQLMSNALRVGPSFHPGPAYAGAAAAAPPVHNPTLIPGPGPVQQTQPPPVTMHGGRPGFAWGGQTMYSPEEVVAWMRARGLHTTVNEFLRNHATIARLYGRAVAHPPRHARANQPA